ncbi:hypothetical protein BC833DRAFT_533632 [Globomyces pollinis-pini]|nr:hypothetical protein BC833DRAFT_533632 [Globomyces pollinis-pini]
MNTTAKSATGEFDAGLFDCTSNMGTCALACFCPCVVYGQNQAALKGGEGCGGAGFLYTLLAAFDCYACIGAHGRGNIREERGIEGGFLGDCVTHYFCAPCALTQEHAELVKAGKK